MDITLIFPKANFKFCEHTLSLGYLKAFIENENAEVHVWVYDLNIDSESELYIHLKTKRPHIIGISANKPLTMPAIYLAQKIRQIVPPDTKLVAGGPQPTLSPEEFLKDFDFVIRGEGEYTLQELVLHSIQNANDYSSIKGLSYKFNDNIYHNASREFIRDLDTLPFPDRSNIMKYTSHRYDDRQIVPMISSRGCPYQCIFCAKEVFGNKIRQRSAKNVYEEMAYIRDTYHLNTFQFRDDSFTFDPKFIEEFCNLLIQHESQFVWYCNTRVDLLTYDRIKLMKSAGCQRISLGIESGDEELLKVLRKEISMTQVYQVVNWMHELGVKVKFFLMIGIPTQDEESINKTINLIHDLKPDNIYCSIFLPFPGTYAWKNKEHLGIKFLFDTDNPTEWERMYYQSIENFKEAYPPVETNLLSAGEIVRLREKIFEAYQNCKNEYH